MPVRQHRLAEQRLRHRRAEQVGGALELRPCAEGAAPGEDGDARRGVQDLGGSIELFIAREPAAFEPLVWDVLGLVALRARRILERLLLDVVGDRQVGDAALRQGGAAGETCHVLHMRGVCDLGVEDGDVVEDPRQVDVLLGEGFDQVVKLLAGNREHRRLIEPGIV